MRNVLLFLVVLMILASCKNSNTQNISVLSEVDTSFSFFLSDYYRESSKDSHSYSKAFSLKSGVLYYDYKYHGYPDNDEKHNQKQLNDSAITAIKTKMQELSLYQNYKKTFPINESGFISESGYTLSIITDTAKYSILVNGGRPMDIDDEIYNKLSELYYFINKIFPQ
ncbi:MAG: hypothetical protein ABIJ97_12370 [Bacteroidota bacterium]